MAVFDFAQPKNCIDLLRNLKQAVDHNYLLETDFYQKRTLLSFFGCQQMEIRRTHGEETALCRYLVTGTKQIIKGFSSGDGAHIRLDRTVTVDVMIDSPELCPTKIAQLDFYLLSENDEVTFEVVTEIFGHDWTFKVQHGTSDGREYLKATHDFGNEKLVYDFTDSMTEKKLEMQLDQGGCLLEAMIRIRRKSG